MRRNSFANSKANPNGNKDRKPNLETIEYSTPEMDFHDIGIENDKLFDEFYFRWWKI